MALEPSVGDNWMRADADGLPPGVIDGAMGWVAVENGALVSHGDARPLEADVVDLGVDRIIAAWYDGPVPGAWPARGADAFEAAGIASLQGLTGAVVLAASLGAILMASVYVVADADARTLHAAVFAGLGHPGKARWLLIMRLAFVLGVAFLAAVLGGYLLWRFGGAGFHPRDTDKSQLAGALLVPPFFAFVAGAGVALWRLRRPLDSLSGPGPVPSRVVLPVAVQPLALGFRLMPILAVAALLFGVQVAMPLAAAAIPGDIAGSDNSFVIGAEEGIPGKPTSLAPARALAFHPDVNAVVGEVLLTTSIQGEAAVIRGADPAAFEAFHGVTLGATDGLVVGARLLDRIDASVGDSVVVQGRNEVARWVPVVGVLDGLADEAWLPLGMAQSLAGLGANQVDVVRASPATDAVRDALDGTPRIEFTALTVLETQGSVVRIALDAVNLDDGPQSRVATIQVNGVPAKTLDVALGAWELKRVEAWILVPPGPYSLQVNPEAEGTGPEPGWGLSATLDGQVTVTATGPEPANQRIGAARSEEAVARGAWVYERTTNAEGQARFPAVEGTWFYGFTDGRSVTTIHVPTPGDLVIESVWTEPARPQAGGLATAFIQVFNPSGEVIEDTVRAGAQEVSLRVEPGDRIIVQRQIVVGASLTIAGESIPLSSGASSARDIGIRDAGSLQRAAADRVLGNAESAIGSLAFVAIASSVAVVGVGARRVLHERRYVVDVLLALGEAPYRVRRRLTVEAAVQATVAGIVAIGLAKLLFVAFNALGAPVTFAHVPQDPFSLLVSFQVLAAFVAAAALPVHVAAEALVESP